MFALARNGLAASGVAAGYWAFAVTGTVLDMPPSSFAIIWPATAFLISVLLLLPERRWWLCPAAVIPAHLVMAAVLYPEARSVVVATEVFGNLLLAFATAFAVRRTIAEPLFGSFSSVLRFVLVAGLAVPAAVNALILLAHVLTGRTADFAGAWTQWMIAGFFPTITLAPLLVLLVRGDFTGRAAAPRSVRVELALLLPALFALSFLAFGELVDGTHWPALFLAPLPLLLWAAVRTGVGGASLSQLVFAGGIIAQALRQNGPFSAHSPTEDVISLQIFLITVSTPLLLLAALLDERRRTAALLRQSEAGMQLAASSTDTALWRWDATTAHLWLTGNCRAMLGLPEGPTLSPFDFVDAVDPEDRALARDALSKALAGEAVPVLEFRLRATDPQRWLVLQTRTERDVNGRMNGICGVFRDISERIESRLAVERLEERLTTLQDDERRRIAQELHDSTAQHLVAAKLHLLDLCKRVDEELQPLVDEAYRSLREATAEIRTFTYLLHASQIEEEGLGAMLKRYVPGFERRTGIRTHLRLCPRADELPGELQHALLRITQESLGNVQRHAGATRAAVDLRCFAGSIHLVVRDDGKGIEPAEGEQLAERLRLGLGLPGLTVRSRAAAGRAYRRGRGRGTTIHIAVPTDSPPPAATRGIANFTREALGAGRG